MPVSSSPPDPKPLTARRDLLAACAALCAAGVAVFSNSFSGPFIFDDLLSIPQNPTIRHLVTALSPPGGGVTVTGRPVLNLSFAINYALSGDQVWSYHALNLLIHLATGLLLFGIVRRTLARLEAGGRVPATLAGRATSVAFASALLWIVHPLQTESVTYLVQRAESLMGLLYLLTLYAFIRGADARRSLPWYVLAVGACLLGMGAKEVMVSAPVLVLLYDRTFLAGSFSEAWRRRHRIHLCLAATWLPLAALVLHAADRGGSAGFGVGVSEAAYVATQFQAVAHYLWLAVWPHPLIVDYGTQWVRSVADVLPYAVVVIALVAGTAVALVRKPALGFLGAWFFAILAPTSLVPIVRQTLAEHRMYLALAPVTVLIAVAAYRWLGRRALWAAVVAAVALGSLTLARNADYRSSESIWRDTVRKRPENPYAHNNYGNLLAAAGREQAALAQYDAAIRLDPTFADPLYNAGKTLARLGRPNEAIARFEAALKLNPSMPDAETELGIALVAVGRETEAVAHFRRALALDPHYVDAHNQLGIALARAGRVAAAATEFEAALAASPNRADLHNNLGNVLRMQGRLTDAIGQYQEATQDDPDFVPAHLSLGNAYRDSNRMADAVAQYEQALRIDPNLPEARNNLGIVLLMSGRTDRAIREFEAALRVDPNLAQVHLNLALALQSAGRAAEAQAQFEAARRLGATLPPGTE
ncbi:TPR repeat-containing protein YrrB [mine drainage metagenome]|uniref:TPR repeat-containing protein YrrB n=1 Tax=mine drainage metagenome TaxID=410659 RepID=A0A1J5S6N4_9ZZZZ